MSDIPTNSGTLAPVSSIDEATNERHEEDTSTTTLPTDAAASEQKAVSHSTTDDTDSEMVVAQPDEPNVQSAKPSPVTEPIPAIEPVASTEPIASVEEIKAPEPTEPTETEESEETATQAVESGTTAEEPGASATSETVKAPVEPIDSASQVGESEAAIETEASAISTEEKPTEPTTEPTPEAASDTDKQQIQPTEQTQYENGPSTEPIPALAIRPKFDFRLHLPRQKSAAIVLLVVLALGVFAPLVVGVSYGIQAYQTYNLLKTHAYSGVQHLLNVKSLFSGPKSSIAGTSSSAGLLDENKLLHARQEFSAAHSDFQKMQSLIDHTPIIQTIDQYLPQYRTQITSARAASQVGIDVANIGQILTSAASILAPQFRGPLLNTSQKPLITSADLNLASNTIDTVLPIINDIQQQTQVMSIDSLPVSAHQREQIQQLVQLLPQIKTTLVLGCSLLPAAGWLLGVNGPRTFLVQTMDRAELRPTGGFTGQYGELRITDGRVAPFSLRDISLVEYADNSPTTDHLAPPTYRSWWPFANWGLRDSNLSADFPTSAQIAINQYNAEVHHRVDGVILFTPFLVEHVLQVTGPIFIPGYNETITAQNLEQRLHYYQLDNAGIAKQIRLSSGKTSTSDRKQFTSLLAHTLMDTLRHAPTETLIALARQMLVDMKTRDLQMYVTNPQLEDLLMRYGAAGQLDRSTTHDGLYVVQANVSASKASQYVRTTIHDTVTLDASGGATHVMQLHLDYHQLGPVYGLDTYRDYVRVYVPPSAKFLWGDGFDTGTPLCGGPLQACPQNSIYPRDQLVCPAGQYDGGASAPMLGDPYAGTFHPLDKIGPPTNKTSDEPGRAMFGGYIVIPKNCSMTATLSWYVPPMGHSPYDLLVQRQAGTVPDLDLTILPTPGDCSSLETLGLYFNGVLSQDASFSLVSSHLTHSGSSVCYSQPGV